MSDLFFGTPTTLKAIIPCYLRSAEEMPILHLSNTLEARDLDPRAEVDRMRLAVTALRIAADEFQEEVQSQSSGKLFSVTELDTQAMLLEKLEPLQQSRNAILEKLERLAGDEQICDQPELLERVANLRIEMLSACAGISVAAWRSAGH